MPGIQSIATKHFFPHTICVKRVGAGKISNYLTFLDHCEKMFAVHTVKCDHFI